jgi:uncharacterized protein (TIGR03435 family)
VVGAGSLAVLCLIALCGSDLLAQNGAPKFEVASVKQNRDGGQMGGLAPLRSGDLVMFHNTQLYTLVFYAYHLTGGYQMAGAVASLGYGGDPTSYFDVEARTGVAATDDEVRLMMQSLLEDRFKLKVHRETKSLPGYELLIDKAKPTMTNSTDKPFVVTVDGRPFPQRADACGTAASIDGSHLVCHAVGMEKITASISNSLRVPVADRTGLKGIYDLHLRYVPDERVLDPNMEPGPSLAKALQEELGLRLEKGSAPVELLIVDHVERPTEN